MVITRCRLSDQEAAERNDSSLSFSLDVPSSLYQQPVKLHCDEVFPTVLASLLIVSRSRPMNLLGWHVCRLDNDAEE